MQRTPTPSPWPSPSPSPSPAVHLVKLSPGLHLLSPLSRRGHGPAMLLLTADHADQLTVASGVPSSMVKWAEEGYVVAEIQASALKMAGAECIGSALAAIKGSAACSSSKVGLVAYDSELWNVAAPYLARFVQIAGAVVYGTVENQKTLAPVSELPMLQHLSYHEQSGARKLSKTGLVATYTYPASKRHFATPFHADFHYISESLSHTRNLQFLKPLTDGPFFDLESIWEEHTHYEFADRSVEHTMSTMVAEPYVNHVPTLAGGIGRGPLTQFYRDHFIYSNPADTKLDLVSRTVGIDRIVDEFVLKLTHDREIDWLLPGVPPTGRKLELPFTAIVNIRGDRLYHEHISWDQGTALKQLGLLPEYLPFPYPLTDDSGATSSNSDNARRQFRVPVLGAETARKLIDRNSVQSNGILGGKVTQA